MTSEKQKMLAGELYNESDPELLADRAHCVEALERFNAERFHSAQWYSSMADLLGGIGTDSIVRKPLMCDYGKNIYIGRHSLVNYDCILMDCAEIRIGDHVLIGPRSQLITGLHPFGYEDARLRAGVSRPDSDREQRVVSGERYCLAGHHNW